MPVYLYKCQKCGKEFNYEQKITEDALTNCPIEICDNENKGSGTVIRKISKNIGLVFNGSGFYLTDYVHKHNSTAPSVDKPEIPKKPDDKKKPDVKEKSAA